MSEDQPAARATDQTGISRRQLVGMGAASIATAALSGMSLAQGGRPYPQPRKSLGEYRVEWSDSALETLRRRIKAFRFPRAIPGSGWQYGMDADYLRALTQYWADGFDMAGAARRLNRYPQYITRVEDLDIHSTFRKSLRQSIST